MPKIQTVKILGLPLHNLSMQDALVAVQDFVEEGGIHQIVTADASMLVTAQVDLELNEIIQRAALVTPDSAGVLWAAKRYGTPIGEKVSGVELVERLCAISTTTKTKIYFLGAAPGIAAHAAKRMNRLYRGCAIVGTNDGFFKPQETEEVLAKIRAAKPDVLCVGFGIPRQEKWIAKHLKNLNVPVVMGVGGSFDVLCGRLKRAPAWMRRSGIEWLYRLIQEPWRWRRIARLPIFAAKIMRQRRP